METAVMAPSPAIDFNFDSSCTSPYMSAPSSPPRFGTPFFSAPTSPTHRISSSSSSPASASALLYIASASISTSLSAIPFNWEDKPGLPKSSPQPNENDKDFAFDFSGQLDKHYLPADELFDGGKIKPLKPPPCLNYESSPKKTFKETFSPRSSKRREFDTDPFAQAFKNTSMQESQMGSNFQRGRERKSSNFDSFNTTTTTPLSSRHNKTRSLSPFRVSDLLFDQETEQQQQQQQQQQQKTDKTSNSSSSWYKKWKIKDLLLFRSASEGRPSSKAQLKKYAVLKKTNTNNNITQDYDDDDSKNMSFRSVDSSVGSSSSSVTNNTSSKRRSSGLISAHELHYTINRAVSEEMKKKTFLPYKQGLLGCLGFQPAAATDISRGVGSMSRGGL